MLKIVHIHAQLLSYRSNNKPTLMINFKINKIDKYILHTFNYKTHPNYRQYEIEIQIEKKNVFEMQKCCILNLLF